MITPRFRPMVAATELLKILQSQLELEKKNDPINASRIEDLQRIMSILKEISRTGKITNPQHIKQFDTFLLKESKKGCRKTSNALQILRPMVCVEKHYFEKKENNVKREAIVLTTSPHLKAVIQSVKEPILYNFLMKSQRLRAHANFAAELPLWIAELDRYIPYSPSAIFGSRIERSRLRTQCLLFIFKQPSLANTIFKSIALISPENRDKLIPLDFLILTSQADNPIRTREIALFLNRAFAEITYYLPIIRAAILDPSEDIMEIITAYSRIDKVQAARKKKMPQLNHTYGIDLEEFNNPTFKYKYLNDIFRNHLNNESLYCALHSLCKTSFNTIANQNLLSQLMQPKIRLLKNKPGPDFATQFDVDELCVYVEESKKEENVSLRSLYQNDFLPLYCLCKNDLEELYISTKEYKNYSYDARFVPLELTFLYENIEEDSFNNLKKVLPSMIFNAIKNKELTFSVVQHGFDIAQILNFLMTNAPALITEKNFLAIGACTRIHSNVLKEVLHALKNSTTLDQLQFDNIINAHFKTPLALKIWLQIAAPHLDLTRLPKAIEFLSPTNMVKFINELKAESSLDQTTFKKALFTLTVKHVHETNLFPFGLSALIASYAPFNVEAKSEAKKLRIR